VVFGAFPENDAKPSAAKFRYPSPHASQGGVGKVHLHSFRLGDHAFHPLDFDLPFRKRDTRVTSE
jgi:hypothetical protein